jgi:hypothetical protein
MRAGEGEARPFLSRAGIDPAPSYAERTTGKTGRPRAELGGGSRASAFLAGGRECAVAAAAPVTMKEGHGTLSCLPPWKGNLRWYFLPWKGRLALERTPP